MRPRAFGLPAPTERSGWWLRARPAAPCAPDLRLVFTGNAFEAPPRTRHQRRKPRERSLRRTLRALVLWLLQPSPFTSRHR
jgi:hypothetical protein